MLRIQAFGELVVLRDGRRADITRLAPECVALLLLLAWAGAAGITRERARTLLRRDARTDEPSIEPAVPLHHTDAVAWAQPTATLLDALGRAHFADAGDTIALDPERSTTDVLDFREALLAHDEERAATLHRGRLVEGLQLPGLPAFNRWLQLQRESLASDAAAACERLARDATQRGEHLTAVRWWRQLATQYPLNDRVAASLMEALVAAGDREGAVRHARFLEALVPERLDRPSDAHVLNLAQALRNAPVVPSSPSANDSAESTISSFSAAISHRYRVEEEVGRGGHGLVLRAYDVRHDRAVAIKLLRPDSASSPVAERFAREIRVIASLQHPNILPLFDSGRVGSMHYYVMPLIEGESLRERLVRSGPLPVVDAVRIAQQVAGALAVAHRRGVVHRDIKPENLLLIDDTTMVADFGIADIHEASANPALTGSGMVVGTAAYMSPEQATPGARLDGRADIYSLACVLHELLTGRPPFRADTFAEVLHLHATQPVPSVARDRTDVPAVLDDVLRRALAKDPANRAATAEAFAVELQTALRTLDQSTGQHATVSALARRARPHRALRWLAALLLTASGVLIAARLTHAPTAAGAPAPAVRASTPLLPEPMP